jgi:valyl-tRNA synthetase
LIEPDAELERLGKRLRKAEADSGKLTAKLSNADFAKNAPPDIVAKDRQRIDELEIEITQLSTQMARVRKLKDN